MRRSSAKCSGSARICGLGSGLATPRHEGKMSLIVLELVVIVALLLVNGVFAMSELAMVSARKVRLGRRADRGDAGARAALALATEPTEFLSAVQVGIT